MAEYIDRKAVIDLLTNRDVVINPNDEVAYIREDVERLPAADVVERKVGKWLFWQDDPDANVYECSACHEPLTLNEGTPRENNFNFCPFCGLPMKEGDDDV